MKSQLEQEGAPHLQWEDQFATIMLRRPQEHNRIDPSDIEVIRAHLAAILDQGKSRAVVFTGSGNKTFSSGYTIQAIVDKLDKSFEDLLDTVENYPLPTICALNGSVYGGATDLALCCDLRIGVRGSRMFMPAAKFGLHYYPGGLRRYIAQLGLAQSKRLFFTAMPIPDVEMLRIGFLTDLVEPGALYSTTRSYVDAIAACEPLVLGTMKQQMNAIARTDSAAATSRDHFELSLRSEELVRRLGRETTPEIRAVR